ncbi:MAG: RidA family protein [Bdellovibrionaceae bacterium]|nr:RidA family protein [Bdellovibrionales bacterium]MCB9083152.1 RidA family protein [Pseudobdellovibrionaceae bacterium]
MSSEHINSSTAPEPVGAYPHARKVGDFIFMSGVGPRQRGSKSIPGVVLNQAGKVVDHDIEVQTRAVIENVKTILADAGSSLEKVVDVTVFLTDMENDFKIFNRVYAEYFASIGPTRTTVQVGALPTPIAVEFKVIATT